MHMPMLENNATTKNNLHQIQKLSSINVQQFNTNEISTPSPVATKYTGPITAVNSIYLISVLLFKTIQYKIVNKIFHIIARFTQKLHSIA